MAKLSPRLSTRLLRARINRLWEMACRSRLSRSPSGSPASHLIEPTESESKEELDSFCDALIEIRREIREVEEGQAPKVGNVLKMAPHPQHDLLVDAWERPYSREQAAYPLAWLREKKFWPTTARIDDARGDMDLFCTCSPVEDVVGEVEETVPCI
ncbi:glycine decarboxylase subunit P [Exophiala xenobiotica]|nr:glycine decarboxylase subunit P [Exophiala xenobiotica]